MEEDEISNDSVSLSIRLVGLWSLRCQACRSYVPTVFTKGYPR